MSSTSDFKITKNGKLTKYTGKGGDVVIPDGVTDIGDRAFTGCTGLTSVVIPDSVTRIGSMAFWGCTSLTVIQVGKGNVKYLSQNGILRQKSFAS